jgi:3-methyl-2-oxobutanoate hydroxymethyltransferase
MKSIFDFKKKKETQQKISMLTCYDFWSAQILNESSIDAILVGDSTAMVMHGHATTLPASVKLMAIHCSAVVKGAPQKFIVGDLPFLSYRKGLTANVQAVHTLMNTGVHAVKLEGATGNLKLIEHLVQSGVPVMGHLGLTPQSVYQLGGYKVQGRDSKAKDLILQQAIDLQNAGCFSLVLECVPHDLGKIITEKLEIATIGIGAGADTDGQILVLHDMLGLNKSFKAKFVRQFLKGESLIASAIEDYHQSVSKSEFPSATESFE